MPPTHPLAQPLGLPPVAAPQPSPVTRREGALVLLLLGAALALRFLFIFHLHFDSDEPQHLHVAWGWLQGQVQYRDFFDNHAPLFHLAWAPVLHLVGQRADVLIWMRLTMLPLFLAALGLTFVIGRSLFDTRTGLWAMALAGLLPPVFVRSVEFRADDLWMVLWLAAVAAWLGGPPRPLRGFLGGLLLGACLGVSIKTTLLLAAWVPGSAVALAVSLRRGHPWVSPRQAVSALAAVAGGAAVVPAVILIGLGRAGALAAFYRCAIAYNSTEGFFSDRRAALGVAALIVGIGLVALAAWWVFRQRAGDGSAQMGGPDATVDGATGSLLPVPGTTEAPGANGWHRPKALAASCQWHRRTASQMTVFLFCGLFLVLLKTIWPTVSQQDYLPMYPLLMVLVAGFLLRLPSALIAANPVLAAGAARWRLGPWFAAGVMLIVELGVLLGVAPWHNRTAPQIAMVAQVLHMTDPDQRVLDLKGETIFRQRAYFPVIETFLKARARHADVTHDLPGVLVRTRTCVATRGDFLGSGGRFVDAHFIPVGALRVAGQYLSLPKPSEPPELPNPTDPGGAAGRPRVIAFDVVIPARYQIVGRDGPVAGLLDGQPLSGPRQLDVGEHRFTPASGSGPWALVWAQAVERGYLPAMP